MLGIKLRRQFVNSLAQISALDDPTARNALLVGLPSGVLLRSNNFRADLDLIVDGLDKLGRLDDQGGTQPLIVIAQRAMENFGIPAGSTLGRELQNILRELEQYYGGEFQPTPSSVPILGEEAVIGTDERVFYNFMSLGVATARSVARLLVPRFFNGQQQSNAAYGTGWLIAPGLIITNHHVINARFKQPPYNELNDATDGDFQAQAQQVIAWFDYQFEGGPHLDCTGAQLVAQNKLLDYALLRLNEANKITDRLSLPMVRPPQPDLQPGARMNIVQHPNGGAMRYAIRHNFYTGREKELIRYITDTEPGSSGSPVLNDDWRVVGLHHAAIKADPGKFPAQLTNDTFNMKIIANKYLNEGIAIHSILDNLPQNLRQEIVKAQQQYWM